MSYINNNICHINKLIDNLSFTRKQTINIIMEGGLFNGSYLIGALYYLKELEKRQYITIRHFSGCSVGSLVPLIYFTNTYNLEKTIYKITYSHFKKELNVNIFDKIFKKLRPYLTPTIMNKINGHLFITYYDICKNKQIIQNKYESVDILFDTIRKSCYCPYMIDHSFLYKKRYIDGFYPYLFKETPHIQNLYLNIHKFDKMMGIISIKNEKTNYCRIISGIIDIHTFFMYKKSTSICSFIEEWSVYDSVCHVLFIYFLKLIPMILHYIYRLKNIFKKMDIYDSHVNYLSTLFYKILRFMYVYLIKKYCI